MAKSKALIPYVSILILTLTATVTSTFAWFTANRDVTVSGNNISIINPKGRLNVYGFEGAGTTVEHENTVAVEIKHHGNFRDGSVDLANEKVFTSNLNVDGELDSSKPYREILNNGSTGQNGGFIETSTNCHIAQNYTLKFTFGDKDTEYGTYGLFFDGEQFDEENVIDGSGIVSANDALNDTDADVARGLRIALCSNSDHQKDKVSKTLVYGPSKYTTLKSEGGVLSYVTGENSLGSFDKTPITGQLAEKVRVKEGSYNKVGEGVNHLGDFVINDQHPDTDYLMIKVWFWFEGTDTKNINRDAVINTDYQVRLNFNVMPYHEVNSGK